MTDHFLFQAFPCTNGKRSRTLGPIWWRGPCFLVTETHIMTRWALVNPWMRRGTEEGGERWCEVCETWTCLILCQHTAVMLLDSPPSLGLGLPDREEHLPLSSPICSFQSPLKDPQFYPCICSEFSVHIFSKRRTQRSQIVGAV